MKKKLLFILGICFLLFPFSTGNTAEGVSINGYDWQNLSASSKTYFVLGWAKCGKHSLNNVVFNSSKWNESIELMNLTQENFKDEGILLGGVTIGQIIDTVDKIYSDPRVKNMDITEVMPFVSGRLIQGWTEKELDEVIAINVKLKQCEARGLIGECGSIRKGKMSYLQKLKKK